MAIFTDASSQILVPRRQFAAKEAIQGVAVDETAFFAISNRAIGKYCKTSGKKLGHWQDSPSHPPKHPLIHMNSGTGYNNRIYCAHSTYPHSPPKNSIEVFDRNTLEHAETIFVSDESAAGSFNWIDRYKDSWWGLFAHYGQSVEDTSLVKFTSDFRVEARWSFPGVVIQRLLPNSVSGGSFGPGGELYVTGHDRDELYVLAVDSGSHRLQYLRTVRAPIEGQAIAWDRSSNPQQLFGILRSKRTVSVCSFHHV